MSGAPNPDPPATADPLQKVQRLLQDDPAALGERLLVLGSGPIPVEGAIGGVLALDGSGATVLVAAFDRGLPAGASGQLADELDRLASLGKKLSPQASNGDLARKHGEFFGVKANGSHLNRRQKAIVVLGDPPALGAWKDLRVDLGSSLAGVFAAKETVESLTPPAQLDRRGNLRWVAGAALAFGLLGFWTGRTTKPEPPVGDGPNISAGSLLADGVGVDATHNQWIGQRRLARTSEGRLVAAYSGAGELQLVEDRLDQGRAWLGPWAVPGVQAQSFSIAVDGQDRVHVAFRDAEGVGYVVATGGPEGWVASPQVRLTEEVSAPLVDIGVDAAGLAHVVWVEGEQDQEPVWAAVGAPLGGEPALLRREALAPPGDELSALVNVAVAPDGQVIATYRRGDSVEGWFARYLVDDVWSPEERLPTPDVLYGAASLAIDRRGIAHLVLRDNTDYGLTYLKRFDGAWGAPETIVDADRTEQIDFPSITADASSEIVYVTYEDTVAVPQGEVMMVSRDPATGWGTPAGVGSPAGLRYPTAPASTLGNNLFLATVQGSAPQILAFRAGPG